MRDLPSFLCSNILGCGENSAHRTGSPVYGRARDLDTSSSCLNFAAFPLALCTVVNTRVFLPTEATYRGTTSTLPLSRYFN